MPRGIDSASNSGRQPPKPRYEIVPATDTGSERRTYSLVGHGPGSGGVQHPARFGSHEAAVGYMEQHGLEHHVPEPSIPPSDAGDVGWPGRYQR